MDICSMAEGSSNQRALPREDLKDGTTDKCLNNLLRKRHNKQLASEFRTTPESVAKRTALRATPQKMKQKKQEQAPKIGKSKLDTGPSLHVGLNKQQSKYKNSFRGLMAPSEPALEHPAAPLLLELATLGCSADTGESWCMERLEAAIKKGAHPSALVPEVATQLREETLEKVDQGYARLVWWADIRDNPPRNLKVSPIAAIPHKSRLFRMILDLSHGVRLHGIQYLSVNAATNKTVAPAEAMRELGNLLPRLIYAVANAPDGHGPILFSKLDIKDGY
jgi:hypothetical protein